MINDTITAAIAGNPMATSRGAATAAGVPNPAEASIKAPKRKAMISSRFLPPITIIPSPGGADLLALCPREVCCST